ncbi:hypothetical protein CGCSCA5_v002885 [Colletotrichum siamense]|uniref:uncharacterized protein n=1 Tax=Colletotrichum siamense TaxID=690259 RepID=UPI00187285C9|nr:uncharacterized protein CGCS363_v011700 [Colletotrichum siamense]KAF4897174.1 hypothetical protein CGCFRS4_v005100 [Colletotrichum fructicola]KAF4822097.1 hypothetical protein CGCSCA5_v002885 [Colletotrichum siamense]KAF4872182.1 hypothetical protein CGCSCA1_v008717 [Colletotrichum siamense]KAF4937467.1 hypothetical protein CGCF245_v005645 [Colletotrichum fructicola]KAF5489314.1 hypothetical protein CGCS363_v011700 [Colletotrichum siamense]
MCVEHKSVCPVCRRLYLVYVAFCHECSTVDVQVLSVQIAEWEAVWSFRQLPLDDKKLKLLTVIVHFYHLVDAFILWKVQVVFFSNTWRNESAPKVSLRKVS